jgi:putative membrane protein insertion efficiency factor
VQPDRKPPLSHRTPASAPSHPRLPWLPLQRLPAGLLIGLVRTYRLAISPMLAPSCRYWPSCSEYAIEALRRHGVVRGGWLTTRRLCRCHPWAAGGVDEVPAARPAAGAVIGSDGGRLAGPSNSNKRWRAYAAERDTSDFPSS